MKESLIFKNSAEGGPDLSHMEVRKVKYGLSLELESCELPETGIAIEVYNPNPEDEDYYSSEIVLDRKQVTKLVTNLRDWLAESTPLTPA